MRTMDMQKKFFGGMLASLLLLAVLLVVFSALLMRERILGAAKESLTTQNTQNGVFIKERLSKYAQICRDAGGFVDFAALEKGGDTHKALLQEARRNNFKNFYYVTAGGELILFNDNLTRLSFDPKLPLIQEALSGKSLVYGPNISYNADKQVVDDLVVSIKVPFEKDGRKTGYAAIDFGGEELSDFTKGMHVSEGGYAFIVKDTLDIIAHPDPAVVAKGVNLEKLAQEHGGLAALVLDIKNLKPEETKIGTAKMDERLYLYSARKIALTDWIQCVFLPNDAIVAQIKKSSLTLSSIGLAITIALSALAFIVSKSMTRSIEKICLALENIADGDGDVRVSLPVRGDDEIARLSSAFNKTMEKIRIAISAVARESAALHEVGGNLSSNMTETAGSVMQISDTIEAVKRQIMGQAASVTETVSTVEEIIRTIKQLNVSVETQAASVAQSSASIEEMIANIASVGQTLETSEAVVRSLVTATDDGRNVVGNTNSITQRLSEESGALLEASGVIQHIASQTNLLAMNAAIEAAHAGESGKGFAVVADEIRKLAEESSEQGKAITATLKKLSAEIESLADSAKIAEEKFNIIFDLSDKVKTMSMEISGAMNEQEGGSMEVLTAMKDITGVTEEVRGGALEMLRGGEETAREMQKLDELTRVIASSMNEMALGASEIKAAIQAVNEISLCNKQSIDNLVKEVDKFKV